jgi:Zn-dependent protease with chaperone function
MTYPDVILAIPCLGLLVLLWLIWRSKVRRLTPSSAPIEQLCGVAVIFLLLAASSALSLSDRVAFFSSRRGGSPVWFEWEPLGSLLVWLFVAGIFFGGALSLWSRDREARRESAVEERP